MVGKQHINIILFLFLVLCQLWLVLSSIILCLLFSQQQ
jgi:hypothetical protein